MSSCAHVFLCPVRGYVIMIGSPEGENKARYDSLMIITQIKIGDPDLNGEWGRARTVKGNKEYM
jgi:hypothetical protein